MRPFLHDRIAGDRAFRGDFGNSPTSREVIQDRRSLSSRAWGSSHLGSIDLPILLSALRTKQTICAISPKPFKLSKMSAGPSRMEKPLPPLPPHEDSGPDRHDDEDTTDRLGETIISSRMSSTTVCWLMLQVLTEYQPLVQVWTHVPSSMKGVVSICGWT